VQNNTAAVRPVAATRAGGHGRAGAPDKPAPERGVADNSNKEKRSFDNDDDNGSTPCIVCALSIA